MSATCHSSVPLTLLGTECPRLEKELRWHERREEKFERGMERKDEREVKMKRREGRSEEERKGEEERGEVMSEKLQQIGALTD